jgi:SMI1 / KNR4 family (SUKH-1)
MNENIHSKVSALWVAILSELGRRHPALPERFFNPCTAEEIAAFENESKLTLPDSVKALYLLADGIIDEYDCIMGGWSWLPLDRAREIQVELIDIEADDPSESYDVITALPLFYSNGDVLYIECNGDSDPSLIYRDHEDPSRDVVANTFSEYLSEYLERIKNGSLVFSADEFDGGANFSLSPASRAYWPPDFDARFPRQPQPNPPANDNVTSGQDSVRTRFESPFSKLPPESSNQNEQNPMGPAKLALYNRFLSTFKR